MKGDGERHYWSRVALSYDRDGEYVVGKAILRAIEEKLQRERSLGHAVEFGCGTGYFTKAIARNATHVTATDVSNTMLEIAQVELEGFDNITIQRADCRDSPFLRESFDSAFLINVIHVVADPSRCLQETNRILRHHGSLIVVDFTGYRMKICKKIGLVFRYLRKWGRPPRSGKNDLSPEELVCLAEHSGFQVKNVELMEAGANAVYLRSKKE